MKILIIGSTSTIGRAIAGICSQIGTVHTAGRRDADLVVDLADVHVFPEPKDDHDVVIHAAADFGGTTDEDFLRAEITNAGGTLIACRLAHRSKARHFVLISSVSAAFTEADPFWNIYGISKHHAEEVAQYFCSKRGMALTVLRPSQVYDVAGECRRHQPLFYQMVDQAARGEDITIFGVHDAVRNYLFLDDLAEIVKQVVLNRPEGAYTCASSHPVRLSEVAEAAFAAFNRGGRVLFDPNRPALPDLVIPEDTRLYDALGISPKVDVREGMARIAAFRNSDKGDVA